MEREGASALRACVVFFEPSCDTCLAEYVPAWEFGCAFSAGLGASHAAGILEGFLTYGAASVFAVYGCCVDGEEELLDVFVSGAGFRHW